MIIENDNFIFLTAISDDDYFTWQVEVLINNFRTYQISNKLNILVCYYGNDYNNKFDTLKSFYSEVSFFFYKNDNVRDYLLYSPVIQSHVLKQHFKCFPELEDKVIFFHDVDIILLKDLSFDELIKDDDTWYVADCSSYLDSNYIRSKGDYILDEMCNIVHIDKNIVLNNDTNVGGAQYILKNVNYKFWEKVEHDSVEIFKYLQSVNNNDLYKKKTDIQHWCASMWGILWNAWLFNHKTRTSDKLSFCMATSSMININKFHFYHNAGATAKRKHELFLKDLFRNILPYNLNFSYVSKEFCSWRYVEEIVKTESKTCLL